VSAPPREEAAAGRGAGGGWFKAGGAHRRSRGCGRARKAAAVACISGASAARGREAVLLRARPPRGEGGEDWIGSDGEDGEAAEQVGGS